MQLNILTNKKVKISFQIFRVILAVLISLYILYYLYSNFEKININLPIYIIAIILILFALSGSFRAIRFYFLCKIVKISNITIKDAFKMTFSANMLNLILPGRIGDGIKILALKNQRKKAVKVIIFEKSTEVAFIFYSLLFLLVFLKIIPFSIELFLLFSIIFGISIFIINFFSGALQEKYLGLKISNKELSFSFFSCIPFEIIEGTALGLIIAYSLSLNASIWFMLALLAGAVMMFVPITPGAIGQWEYGVAVVVTYYSSNFAMGVFIGVVYRILIMVTLIIIGIIPSFSYLALEQKQKSIEKLNVNFINQS